jgi:hypothetical protein
MSQPEAERARALLQRAEADLAAVRARHRISSNSLDRFLLDLLDDHRLAPPPDLHGVTDLYPFGVQLRYEAPLDEEPLDRPAMRELLDRLRAWTAERIS